MNDNLKTHVLEFSIPYIDVVNGLNDLDKGLNCLNSWFKISIFHTKLVAIEFRVSPFVSPFSTGETRIRADLDVNEVNVLDLYCVFHVVLMGEDSEVEVFFNTFVTKLKGRSSLTFTTFKDGSYAALQKESIKFRGLLGLFST